MRGGGGGGERKVVRAGKGLPQYRQVQVAGKNDKLIIHLVLNSAPCSSRNRHARGFSLTMAT